MDNFPTKEESLNTFDLGFVLSSEFQRLLCLAADEGHLGAILQNVYSNRRRAEPGN